MYYSAIALLALVILIIENFDILLNLGGGFGSPTWKVYRRFLFAVLAYFVVDVLWGILENMKAAKLLFADTTVYFILISVGVLYWGEFTVSYLEEKAGFGRLLITAARVVAGVITLLTVINIFTPVLFTVDEQSVYSALPARYVMLIVQILLLLLISLHAFITILRLRPANRTRYRALALFGLIMALFLLIQLWLPYYPLYSVAYMLGSSLLHTFVVNDEKIEYMQSLKKQEEQTAYVRLSALAGEILCVDVVNPETGEYREFNSSDDYRIFERAKKGTDFFTVTREAAPGVVYPEDLKRFLMAFTKENVMAAIGQSGIFTLSYRLVRDGKPFYARIKAAVAEEQEGRQLIVGVINVDAQVRQEEQYGQRLARAETQASVDALTGVRNRYAFLEAEGNMDRLIAEKRQGPFAMTVLDVNELKKVNDEKGHQAGDEYLRGACRIVCETFAHSPVFRIGGDEFAVISQGNDYARIDALMEKLEARNRAAIRSGGIVVAAGMAKYEGEPTVAPVFSRADHAMYENKSSLKALRADGQRL